MDDQTLEHLFDKAMTHVATAKRSLDKLLNTEQEQPEGLTELRETLHRTRERNMELLKENEGLKKSDARFKRRSAKLSDEISNMIVKRANLGYEIKGLSPLSMDHDEDRWHEYEAKYTDGKLISITQIPARNPPRPLSLETTPDENQ